MDLDLYYGNVSVSNFQSNDDDYAVAENDGSIIEKEEPSDCEGFDDWNESHEVPSASDHDYSEESFESTSAQHEPDVLMCLSFNLQYQEMMKNVIMELEIALENNRMRQAVLQEELNSEVKKTSRSNKRSFFSKPHPYFQDKDNVVCPANEDKRIKDGNGEIDMNLCYATQFWTYQEKMTLREAVLKSAKKSRMEPVMERKEFLCEKLFSGDLAADEKKNIKAKLKEIDLELESIRHLSINHLCSSDIRIDWMTISNIDMNNLRTAEACEMKWKNQLHPFINRTRWTVEEDDTLKSLVQKHNHENWDHIALELETNRTALQCCERYQQRINPVVQKGIWSEEEKQLLLDVVEMCSYGNYIPWVQVHYYMEGRSLATLRRYWSCIANPVIIRGRWTPEEDFLLIAAVKKHGFKWQKIASLFGSRTSIQCRDRYKNSLHEKISFRSWTGREDRQLVRLVEELGPKWASISKHFPDRTDSMLSVRYKNIIKRCPNILEILENEEDRPNDFVMPLIPTNNKTRCNQRRRDLHKHVEIRKLSLVQQLAKTRPLMRKTMRKSTKSKSCEEEVGFNPHTENNLVFQEAKTVYLNSSRVSKQRVRGGEQKRKAIRNADVQLGTMLSPILKRQPAPCRKFKALTGKSLVEYVKTRSVFYQALKVEVPHEEGLTDVSDNVHDAKIAQTIEKHCLGPVSDRVIALPPVRSTLEGFKTLLADLKRLADSATVLDHFSSTAIQVLTKRKGQPLICSSCESRSNQEEISDLSELQRDVSQPKTIDHSGVEVVTENVSSKKDCTQHECPNCSRLNRVDQKYSLLRSRFMALFFWPALMSTVAPPIQELTRKEDCLTSNNAPENLKRKQPPSEDQPVQRRPRKKGPPAPKERKRKIRHAHYTEDGSVVAVRKSSRQAGMQS